MPEPIELQKALNGQKFITALEGKKIHIYKEGKTNYANLFISEGKVYASSIREDNSIFAGKVIITNLKLLAKREIRPTDKIEITQLLPAMVIGEIVEEYSN